MGGFYTTNDLAAEIGMATETVARWIREGRFPGAFRRGDRWRIPYDEAKSFMRERGWTDEDEDCEGEHEDDEEDEDE